MRGACATMVASTLTTAPLVRGELRRHVAQQHACRSPSTFASVSGSAGRCRPGPAAPSSASQIACAARRHPSALPGPGGRGCAPADHQLSCRNQRVHVEALTYAQSSSRENCLRDGEIFVPGDLGGSPRLPGTSAASSPAAPPRSIRRSPRPSSWRSACASPARNICGVCASHSCARSSVPAMRCAPASSLLTRFTVSAAGNARMPPIWSFLQSSQSRARSAGGRQGRAASCTSIQSSAFTAPIAATSPLYTESRRVAPRAIQRLELAGKRAPVVTGEALSAGASTTNTVSTPADGRGPQRRATAVGLQRGEVLLGLDGGKAAAAARRRDQRVAGQSKNSMNSSKYNCFRHASRPAPR